MKDCKNRYFWPNNAGYNAVSVIHEGTIMSSGNRKIDFASGVFVFGVFTLIIFFWGEPDLHEALIHNLMADGASTTAVAEQP